MSSRVTIALVLFALLLTGCYEMIAWSPDGRYLAFVGPGDMKLWQWDTETSQTTMLSDKEILACKYLNGGEAILLAKQHGQSDEYLDLVQLDLKSGDLTRLAEKTLAYSYDVSNDGKRLYYITERFPENLPYRTSEIHERTLGDSSADMVLLEQKETIGFVSVAPRTRRILFTNAEPEIKVSGSEREAAEAVLLLDADSGAIETILTGPPGRSLWWPTWLDEERVIYLLDTEESDEVGVLYAYSMKTQKSIKLLEHIQLMVRPSVSPDGKTVAVTAMP
ncbi:MAG TPA: hypothetical protein HPP83_09405 [Candidatus Hydrogenedentes bacterium]|nr:hypothetical protein [Candidatus Hydrogenedentota bacterium]